MSPFPIKYDADADDILGDMIYKASFTAKLFAATDTNDVPNTSKERERELLLDHGPFPDSPLPFPASKPWFGNTASIPEDFKSSYEPHPPPKRARQKVDCTFADRRTNFPSVSTSKMQMHASFQHSAYGMALSTANAMFPMPFSPKATKTSHPSQQNLTSSNKSTMPTRPYTAYTIFFRLERALMNQSSGIFGDQEVVTSLEQTNHFDPLEHPRPAGYETVILEPYWYSSSKKRVREKKRKHVKTAGKLAVTTLSKRISEKWKNSAGSEVMAYCVKLAKTDTIKYHKLMLQAHMVNEHQTVNHCTKKATKEGALVVRHDTPDQVPARRVSQDYPPHNTRLCTTCGCTNSILEGSVLVCAIHGEESLRGAQNNTRLCTAGGCTTSIPEGSVICAMHGIELLRAQRRLKNNACPLTYVPTIQRR